MKLKTSRKEFILTEDDNYVIDLTKVKYIDIYPDLESDRYIVETNKKKYYIKFDYLKYYHLIDFLRKAKVKFSVGVSFREVPFWFWNSSKETIYEDYKLWRMVSDSKIAELSKDKNKKITKSKKVSRRK